MEFRIKDCQLQTDDDGLLRVGGYINVTERESEMLFNKKKGKWFKEVMKKGVFKRAIERAGKNIPLLFEHNWDKKLASVEEGSLTLKEDNIGLRFDAVINDESIYQQVKAGIINSCSFGFRALAEEVESINTRLEKRFVSAIELLEVSLVKNPAYVGSLVETRAYEEELNEEKCAPKEVRENSSEDEVVEEVKDELEDKKEDEVQEKEDKSDDKDDVTEEELEEKEEKEVLADDAEENKRFNEEVVTQEEKLEIELSKEYLASLVDELIEAKMNEIKIAEEIESAKTQEAQEIKEIHKEIESEVERQTMMQNAEVVKLRLQLLKLKEVKEGI